MTKIIGEPVTGYGCARAPRTFLPSASSGKTAIIVVDSTGDATETSTFIARRGMLAQFERGWINESARCNDGAGAFVD